MNQSSPPSPAAYISEPFHSVDFGSRLAQVRPPWYAKYNFFDDWTAYNLDATNNIPKGSLERTRWGIERSTWRPGEMPWSDSQQKYVKE
jgi:hypothetical protein